MLKGWKYGWMTALLHLAPYRLSGRNVCPKASPACAEACLNTAGRGQMNSVQRARLNKTKYFFQNRSGFLWQLSREIEMLKKRVTRKGYRFAVRLNGTSDLSWEKFKLLDGQSLQDLHPDVQFYDYTKILNRLESLPKNYHMTFSYSGTNQDECIKAADRGFNVATVFRGALPRKWLGMRVINGDDHDLRFQDPAGVVVGLVAKGKARKQMSSFVVQPEAAWFFYYRY